MMRFVSGTMIAAAIAMSVSAAQAGVIVISGSGTWGSSAPTSTWSAPNETYSFSFDLPDPPNSASPAPGTDITGGYVTTQITNFVYDLNGSSVGGTPTYGVEFYPASFGGGFDLLFSSSNADLVDFYGPVIESAAGGNIPLGTYTENIDFSLTNFPSGNGTASIVVSSLSVPAAAPEPATWALLLFGFAGVAATSWVQGRRRTA